MDRLWAMEVFVKVVEAGSLSNAARQLDLSNASVTTCIRNLETHLGVTLLQRTTRHVKLTDVGESFYARCRNVLSEVEEAEATAARSKITPVGTLRLQLPITFGNFIVGPQLVRFAAQHPEVNIVVTLSNSIDNLIQRGVDVALRMDQINDGDLIARWIFETRHVLCCSPSFLKQHQNIRHPTEIDPKLCLGLRSADSQGPRSWHFSRENEEIEIIPRGNLSFNSSDALLHVAARNGGFIYVLDILAEEYLKSGELVELLPDWKTDIQTFYAVYPQSRFVSPKVRAFVEFLGEIFTDRPTEDSITVPAIGRGQPKPHLVRK